MLNFICDMHACSLGCSPSSLVLTLDADSDATALFAKLNDNNTRIYVGIALLPAC